MKTLSYILIFVVIVKIVSYMAFTFISTFLTSDFVWYGSLIGAMALAGYGIYDDMKIKDEKNS